MDGIEVLNLDVVFEEYRKQEEIKKRDKIISDTYDKIIRLLKTQKDFTLERYKEEASKIDAYAFDYAKDHSLIVNN